MERGHPVRLSAQREQALKEIPGSSMSVLRTLADKDVRAPIRCSVTKMQLAFQPTRTLWLITPGWTDPTYLIRAHRFEFRMR
jgi:hypothetical protein